MHKKTIFILLLFTIIITSCRSKKEVNCPSFDQTEEVDKEKADKKSKYSIVILKDGKRIRKKRKKSKNRLFK